MLRNIAVLVLIASLSNCEEEAGKNDPADPEYIKYGTSFGECLGYCVKTIKVTDSKIEFYKNGWDLNGILPEVSYTEAINNYYWRMLAEKIDYDSFLRLGTAIGCPDCTDGGAVWIEIKVNDTVHKVIFENENEPDEVKEYIGYLRAYINTFAIDSNETVNFNKRTLINQKALIKSFACSIGCFQYLIELPGSDNIFYYDNNLKVEYQKDNLKIEFDGVLQYDSTMIYKPAPNDVPIPDFKVRNIKIFSVTIISD